ncbi:DUF92 domain-containing protein [Neobacillus sp. D3-1R]|uniref:DUF92 domain-containing protein n=1 Tax=Neobacillus sp. D3-1R TaxID=3445778 RepID=UPI003F9F217C
MFHMVISFCILFVSFIAFKIQALSKSGALASSFVGASIYLGFGIKGLALLGIFFVTSSLWSKFKAKQKKVIEEKLEKGSQRDWVQVFANGGVAAITSLIFYYTNDMIWEIAFLISMASATGDTWSSEIGPLSKTNPISIKNFNKVPAGTSGAISMLGTIGALSGVLLITIIGYILFPIHFKIALFVLLFGIVGNGIDTILGAFYQRSFCCKVCHMEMERSTHCGEPARLKSGEKWLTNDGVNFLSCLGAPVLALIFLM